MWPHSSNRSGMRPFHGGKPASATNETEKSVPRGAPRVARYEVRRDNVLLLLRVKCEPPFGFQIAGTSQGQGDP